jgi:hypothetical protein
MRYVGELQMGEGLTQTYIPDESATDPELADDIANPMVDVSSHEDRRTAKLLLLLSYATLDGRKSLFCTLNLEDITTTCFSYV